MTEKSKTLLPVLTNRFRATFEDFKLTRSVRRVEGFTTRAADEFRIVFFESLDFSPMEYFRISDEVTGSIDLLDGEGGILRKFPFRASIVNIEMDDLSYENCEPLNSTLTLKRFK